MAKKPHKKKKGTEAEAGFRQHVLVLGAGFIGSSVVASLLKEKNYTVTLLYHKNKPSGFSEGCDLTIVQGDIRDIHSLRKVMREGDVVINATGQLKDNFDIFSAVNLNGARNLVAVGKEKRIRKFIHISSTMVYGDLEGTGKKSFKETDTPHPINEYARIKQDAEQIFKASAASLPSHIIILRLGNTYGPHGKGIINTIIDSLSNGKQVIINNDGNQYRDFVYIDDVTDAIKKVLAYEPSSPCEIFNICNDTQTAVNDVISFIRKKHPLTVMYNNPTTHQLLKNRADNTKTKNVLHFIPRVSLSSGIGILLQQAKKQPLALKKPKLKKM